jgi:MFS family permease
MGGLTYAGAAFSSIMGGLAVTFMPVWVLMLATAVLSSISFSLCFFLHEPEREVYSHPRGTLYGLYKIARYIFLRSKIVRAAVPLLAATSLATMLGVWLYQPLWEERQVPIFLFGLLWALLFLPSMLGSHFAHRLEKLLGKKGIILILPLFPLVGYMLAGLLPGVWAVLPIFLVNFLRGIAGPVLTRFIHEETYSDKRATVLSIQSFIFRLSYSGLAPFLGLVALHAGLRGAFLVSAALSAILIIIFIPFFLKRAKDWRIHTEKESR